MKFLRTLRSLFRKQKLNSEMTEEVPLDKLGALSLSKQRHHAGLQAELS